MNQPNNAAPQQVSTPTSMSNIHPVDNPPLATATQTEQNSLESLPQVNEESKSVEVIELENLKNEFRQLRIDHYNKHVMMRLVQNEQIKLGYSWDTHQIRSKKRLQCIASIYVFREGTTTDSRRYTGCFQLFQPWMTPDISICSFCLKTDKLCKYFHENLPPGRLICP